MPTYQLCPPGAAKGLDTRKVKAAYGMMVTITTIAPAHQSDRSKSAVGIVQAKWSYTPGRSRLIKGATNLTR